MDRTFKEISIDGLVPFAFGGTGECYRLDEDKILKLHYSGYNPERVIQEKANSVAAIRNDIPTALSYELVRVGDRIGIIYEMIDAKDISTVLRKDRSRTTELGIKFARLARDVHRNIDDKGQFPKVTRFIRDSINRIDYVSAKAKDRMLSFIYGLDRYHNFLHGDFHTNNALVTDKGLFLIDMVGFASGCPVFDVATLYFSFYSSPDAFEGGVNRFNELDSDTQNEFWEAFRNEYFGPDNSYILDILPKVVLLKQMNFEFAFGKRCSEAYCRKVREDVVKEFDS